MKMNNQKGVGLIEIMVSLLILSIGLLGLASLQAQGLRYNQGAYYRSMATVMVSDMADRINANPTAKAAGTYDALTTSTLVGAVPACITAATGCSTANLVTYDMVEWCKNFSDCNAVAPVSTLPTSSGTIVRAAGVFTVTVSWEESSDVNDPIKSVSVSFL